MRDFLPVLELLAKAARTGYRNGYRTGCDVARSGLSVVGALVDCGIPRQHAGAQWLTEKEAEEEVADPTPSDWFRETAFNVGIDPQVVERLQRNPEAMARLAEAEATMDQAEELRLCDDCGHDDQRHATGTGPVWPCTVRGCHCYDILFIKSPAVSATDSAVEDPSVGVPPAPTEADSIKDVLAEHYLETYSDRKIVGCRCGLEVGSRQQHWDHQADLISGALKARAQAAEK